MTTAPVEYVRAQITNHARLFFTEPAARLLQSDAIRFLTYAEAVAMRGRQIVIPVDLPVPPVPELPWQVQFNGTVLTLWNRAPHPDGDHWRAIPNETAPVWYQHVSGTLMPSWNLFGNTFDLLTFGEEQRLSQRDHHDRFAAAFSPRLERGLLEVPAVNETVALVVAAVVAMSHTGQPSFTLDCLSGPPVVVLSHDCDALLGNDFWTQSVRLYRFIQSLVRLRLPRLSNLWWLARNAVTPRRFYFDNATGMIDIERCFGYTSTFYLLNGSGGRFGARSPFSVIPQLLEHIPPSWDIGIHYNYDTFLNQDRFAAQLEQLQEVVSHQFVSGRAHYLKFDPFRSFSFLQQFGIYVDESSGWADYVGYRNGIAGCFQAYDTEKQLPLDIWEVPMVIMEAALIKQHGADAVNFVERQLQHLSCIGGALTILVHPGQFFNPEHRQMLGIYHELLKVCRRMGAITHTARSLVDQLRR
ncbi:MAG: hypothetical protein DRP47_03740 [Candidatus Zixiibacteriota bacterium]|nr:MAG: hypothetical protein DRP47_03740 [candidate division Zixibacteria bacterium]